MFYVAVDIGCIECGEDSSVLGIFHTRDAAREVVSEHSRRQQEHWSGQHRFLVCEVENLDKVYRVEY
jgi:hypothetical protein